MKKNPLIMLVVAILSFLLFFGCKPEHENQTKEYLIIDQKSNKILNRYEYSVDTEELVKTLSYTDSEKLDKQIEYEYDDKGFLIKTIESIPGKPPKTITYTTKTEFDSAGRLVKIIRTSSDGEVVETNFGYDETGTLRGVVEKDSKGDLLMQDY